MDGGHFDCASCCRCTDCLKPEKFHAGYHAKTRAIWRASFVLPARLLRASGRTWIGGALFIGPEAGFRVWKRPEERAMKSGWLRLVRMAGGTRRGW